MKVADDFEHCRNLTDRFLQTKMMKMCEFECDGVKVFVPEVLEIPGDTTVDKVRELIVSNKLKFPLLSKPALASGGADAHDMRLVFSEDRLCDLKLPCLVQEFCNHSGVVYKVYIINEQFFICEKPSIKDVDPQNRDTLFFDTRDISKLGKSFDPDIHGEDPNKRNWLTCDENPDLLNRKVVGKLSRLVRGSTKLVLLGIDILVEADTGNYALIDVNHFPGYSGIQEERIQRAFVDMIKNSINC